MLIVLDRVVALGSHDEISGNKLSSLMKKLVEGVLGIGGGLSEQNRSGGILYVLAAASNGFTVGLHGQLLEVCWEPVEVLVEANNSQNASIMLRKTNTYGETRCVWAPKKSEYQTLSKPPSTGMFFSRGVSLKCLSMAWAPARN